VRESGPIINEQYTFQDATVITFFSGIKKDRVSFETFAGVNVTLQM